jgi:hypothetical protein
MVQQSIVVGLVGSVQKTGGLGKYDEHFHVRSCWQGLLAKMGHTAEIVHYVLGLSFLVKTLTVSDGCWWRVVEAQTLTY